MRALHRDGMSFVDRVRNQPIPVTGEDGGNRKAQIAKNAAMEIQQNQDKVRGGQTAQKEERSW